MMLLSKTLLSKTLLSKSFLSKDWRMLPRRRHHGNRHETAGGLWVDRGGGSMAI
jgi:hypothetical protein